MNSFFLGLYDRHFCALSIRENIRAHWPQQITNNIPKRHHASHVVAYAYSLLCFDLLTPLLMPVPLFLLHNAQLISHQSFIHHTKKIPHRMLHNGSCQWKGTLVSQHTMHPFTCLHNDYYYYYLVYNNNDPTADLQIKECPDFFHRKLGILDHTITKCSLYHLCLKTSCSITLSLLQQLI